MLCTMLAGGRKHEMVLVLPEALSRFIFYIQFIHKVESPPLSKVKIFTRHSETEPVKGEVSSALFNFWAVKCNNKLREMGLPYRNTHLAMGIVRDPKPGTLAQPVQSHWVKSLLLAMVGLLRGVCGVERKGDIKCATKKKKWSCSASKDLRWRIGAANLAGSFLMIVFVIFYVKNDKMEVEIKATPCWLMEKDDPSLLTEINA